MRIASWIPKATNAHTYTHGLCNTHCFSTITMVSSKRLNVMLYVICLSFIYMGFCSLMLDVVWNVMAHAQKPDFVFRRNGRVHLNRLGASVQSTAGSRGVRISGSNAEYTTFRGSVNSTGYQLHSPVSPSHPLWCITVCHQHFNWTLHEDKLLYSSLC